MKALIWIVAAVLALCWTGFVAVSAALLSWAGEAIASGGVADWGRAASQWPVPEWIALWIDPGLVRALQEAVRWGLDMMGGTLPAAGTLVGWLAPLAWVAWGFGMVLLLALAAGGHWLAGRQRPAWQSPAQPAG